MKPKSDWVTFSSIAQHIFFIVSHSLWCHSIETIIKKTESDIGSVHQQCHTIELNLLRNERDKESLLLTGIKLVSFRTTVLC